MARFDRHSPVHGRSSVTAEQVSSTQTRLWAWALPIVMACNGSSPTAPRPELGITFTVTNPATLSLSDPERCPGDLSTCSKSFQSQGDAATTISAMRHYILEPGTYRLSGVLRPTTSDGASIRVSIGSRETSGTTRIAVHGYTVFTLPEERSSPGGSVISERCGGTFTVPAGALGWSVIFEVVDGADAASRQPCPSRFVPRP